MGNKNLRSAFPGRRMVSWLGRIFVDYFRSLSFVGLAFAVSFFSVSVTPSLIPRTYLVQGLVSGFAFATGYAVGVGFVFLWEVMQLGQPGHKTAVRLKSVVSLIGAAVMAGFLWKMASWQNSIRVQMSMPTVDSSYCLLMGMVAVGTAAILLLLGRLFFACSQYATTRLKRILPNRIAKAIGFFAVGFLALLLVRNVILTNLLRAADQAFAQIDRLDEVGMAAPQDLSATGSVESLVAWDTIGRKGKEFLRNGPTRAEISRLTAKQSKRPIRVYVGYRSGDDARERARLAVEELKRIGGFERKILIVATPTGTGWLDPNAVDTVEYLHAGDTAIVCTQYSYLPSWLTILVDPNRSCESAQALFNEVYAHWTRLPKESRPRLYLHGLSLGAMGGETSADLYTVFEDPINGAVFSGTPFPSQRWQELVRGRNLDSPIWLPTYRDQAMVRFMNRSADFDAEQRWSPIRTVYIQYPSDPMIWFSTDLAFQRPEWLDDPRGYDVSPALRWYPIVTFLQIAFDLPLATSTPLGYGHNYSAESYIDAWKIVTSPEGWTETDLTRLKEVLAGESKVP